MVTTYQMGGLNEMKKKISPRLKKVIENDRKERREEKRREEKYKPVENLLKKNNYKPKFLFLSDLIRKFKV